MADQLQCVIFGGEPAIDALRQRGILLGLVRRLDVIPILAHPLFELAYTFEATRQHLFPCGAFGSRAGEVGGGPDLSNIVANILYQRAALHPAVDLKRGLVQLSHRMQGCAAQHHHQQQHDAEADDQARGDA